MSITQVRAPRPEQRAAAPLRPRIGRLVALCLFLLLSLGSLLWLRPIVPTVYGDVTIFTRGWLISFLPYLACALFILGTRPQQGYWQWVELGIILLGALLMRAIFLPALPSNLSHDVWRYLWDARVTLHGYSPYVTAPKNPALTALQDQFIYGHLDYRNAPSLYPPMAQAVYILSYLLAPSNLLMLKTIFLGFDLATCCTLALLLKRRGLDPARCLIYAWCPLPIIEFALQGHIDVVMLTLLLLMLVCATSRRRGVRIVMGVLLGLATLTKLYPIILLVVVMRRRDYVPALACLATILLGYLPYLILGHGQVLGFFSTYITQRGGNAGVVLIALAKTGKLLGVSSTVMLSIEHGFDVLFLGGLALLVFFLRERERISMEAAILLLIGAIFSISSFVYPWYVTALLPWVALLLGPLWQRTSGRLKLEAKGVAMVAAWYFVCTSVTVYFSLAKNDYWALYYGAIYGVTCVLLCIAGFKVISRSAISGSAIQRKLLCGIRSIRREQRPASQGRKSSGVLR